MWTWRWMGGAVLALPLASACSGAVSDVPASGSKADDPRGTGTGDAPIRDAGGDAGGATRTRGCTGSGALPIAGDFVAADGSEHWLRVAAHATTYTRVPAGPPTPTSPPRLDRVVKICADQRSFVAASATGAFTRVDWAADPGGLRLCVAAEDEADLASALEAAATNAQSSSGCRGRPWIALARISDGGR